MCDRNTLPVFKLWMFHVFQVWQFLILCFLVFQASMDLPPDKAKLLKQYDDEKKWDIICDQVSEFYYLWSGVFILSCVY
jgi:hypothetical protein